MTPFPKCQTNSQVEPTTVLAGTLSSLVTKKKYIITYTYVKNLPQDNDEIHICRKQLKVTIHKGPENDSEFNVKITNIPKVDENKSKNNKKRNNQLNKK